MAARFPEEQPIIQPNGLQPKNVDFTITALSGSRTDWIARNEIPKMKQFGRILKWCVVGLSGRLGRKPFTILDRLRV